MLSKEAASDNIRKVDEALETDRDTGEQFFQ
jgi:hypothetical protein